MYIYNVHTDNAITIHVRHCSSSRRDKNRSGGVFSVDEEGRGLSLYDIYRVLYPPYIRVHGAKKYKNPSLIIITRVRTAFIFIRTYNMCERTPSRGTV